MSNSPLVNYTCISPNKTSPRNHKIDTITIHHMAGNASVETCGDVFKPKSRKASSNYGIGSDGRVGMYVEEKDRSWATSSAANDNRAVTIEVANCSGDPDWKVSDKALAKLIDLCVDICQRNGIKKLNYTGDKSGNLTMHKWFAATGCPGPYLGGKFPYIASEVNKRLGNKTTTTTTTSATTSTTKPTTSTTKSIEQVAQEVIAGKWGAGTERKKRITEAGYDYNAVQAKVNELMSGSTTTTKKVVHTVVKGDTMWGIAAKYLGSGSRYPEIVKLNNLKSTVVYVGQKLTIPNK